MTADEIGTGGTPSHVPTSSGLACISTNNGVAVVGRVGEAFEDDMVGRKEGGWNLGSVDILTVLVARTKLVVLEKFQRGGEF